MADEGQDLEHEVFEAEFSDFYERALPRARHNEVEQHLAGCPRCRASYAKFKETLSTLSGLHKMSAPQALPERVKTTIHRRSAGRFFGRKAFGDRVPFEAIAIIGLVLVVVLYFLLKTSSTGSLSEPIKQEKAPAPLAPGAEGVMPTP